MDDYWDYEYDLAKIADKYNLSIEELIDNLDDYPKELYNMVWTILENQEAILESVLLEEVKKQSRHLRLVR